MIMLRNLSTAALLVLVGCTTVDVPGHPEAIAAIQSYYAANAWEEGARCVSPSMTVTRTNILEDTPERLVVEARYYWQDGRRSSDNAAVTCSGFETRTFTLAQGRVVSMTGEQRR
ncbi:MAG TPA: hypothetical protein VHL31_13155 [Geminicoccus sp.]|uniref:hypothetical protein n=1 Tax=Geminicoccus sp. TaxID=2024832 RepID=UPI002E351202|nr:hypothetical protein [Geminicoccus sp.]HEX2527229.1 hypothetical protein [Geminicoccus sp.]